MLNNLKSYKKLKELAQNPIDLTKEKTFNPDRIKNMVQKSLGYKLLYATENVTDQVMESLFDLANEMKAIDKLQEMQDGKIINLINGQKSENRQVLHTATRDFFEDQNKKEPAKKAKDLAYEEFSKLKIFLEQIDKKDSFQNIVQVGIGGSFLATKAIYEALKKYTVKNKKAYFIANVDPDDSTSILNSLDLSKTLFISVSKSGTTLETLTNEEIVRSKLNEKNLSPKDHIVSITGEKSPMDDPSRYLESFYIWDFIGGRYSVTSMVGAVCLGFCFGIDVLKDFLKGANHMDKASLKKGPSNLSLLSALLGIWNRNFLNYSNIAIIPYSQGLAYFPNHLQQLDMESNGKAINKQGEFIEYKTGPIVFGDIGTNAQHSFFQLLHQGKDIVPIEFIGYKNSQYGKDLKVKNTSSQEKLLSNLLAQSIALAIGKKDENPNKTFLGNRPNHILLGNMLTPYSLGVLLSYFENKIALQGFIWDINSFDQEGVQLGKVLANKFLDLFSKRGEGFEIGKTYLNELKNI